MLQRRQIMYKGVHGFIVKCNQHKMSFRRFSPPDLHVKTSFMCDSRLIGMELKQSGRHTGLLINKSASNCWPSGVFKSKEASAVSLFVDQKRVQPWIWSLLGCYEKVCIKSSLQTCYSLKSDQYRCFPPVHSPNLFAISNQKTEMYLKILRGHVLHL